MKENNINILYEDNHLLVVVKPCNVLSQADSTKDMDLLTMLKDYIREKYKKPGNVFLGLVHRLDRPVSGIMVYAKTSKAASRLTKDIQQDKFKKKYLAVISNIIKEDEGVYEDYLKRTPDGKSVITKEQYGKYAKLEYKVLERNNEEKKTLVDITLITGRHHQIRVQFSSKGNSLCGDQRYGKQDKTQIALHAYELSFPHPISKEIMTFTNKPIKKGHWTNFTL